MNPQAQDNTQQPTQPVQATPQPEQKEIQVRFEDDLILSFKEDALDDMRLFDVLDEFSTTNEFALRRLFPILFGQKQWETAYAYYEKAGRPFKISHMMKVFEEQVAPHLQDPAFLRK